MKPCTSIAAAARTFPAARGITAAGGISAAGAAGRR